MKWHPGRYRRGNTLAGRKDVQSGGCLALRAPGGNPGKLDSTTMKTRIFRRHHDRRCLQCRQPFWQHAGMHAHYCSPACINQAKAEGLLAPANRPNASIKPCPICGKRFVKPRPDSRITCSDECHQAQIIKTRAKNAGPWYVMSPNRTVYRIECVAKFVRENSDLFSWCDLVPLRAGGGNGTTTYATMRLGELRTGRIVKWDGWKKATQEQFENQ